MTTVRVGIDIGGGSIKMVTVTRRIEHSSIVRTPKTEKEFFATLSELLRTVPHKKIAGIGVAVPGVVTPTGKVLAAPNVPFLRGDKLPRSLKVFSSKIYFDNDVRCIARAEQTFGAAQGFQNAVVLALGTGVGGAVIIRGQLYYGTGSAGEIGHMLLEQGKSFEALAGGKTIRKHNDAEFKRVGKYLGIASANIINMLAPEVLVYCGGVMQHHGKPILKYAKPQLQRLVLNPSSQRTKLVFGALGELAGSLGASLLVS